MKKEKNELFLYESEFVEELDDDVIDYVVHIHYNSRARMPFLWKYVLFTTKIFDEETRKKYGLNLLGKSKYYIKVHNKRYMSGRKDVIYIFKKAEKKAMKYAKKQRKKNKS